MSLSALLASRYPRPATHHRNGSFGPHGGLRLGRGKRSRRLYRLGSPCINGSTGSSNKRGRPLREGLDPGRPPTGITAARPRAACAKPAVVLQARTAVAEHAQRAELQHESSSCSARQSLNVVSFSLPNCQRCAASHQAPYTPKSSVERNDAFVRFGRFNSNYLSYLSYLHYLNYPMHSSICGSRPPPYVRPITVTPSLAVYLEAPGLRVPCCPWYEPSA